jgi:hypothetical protein
MTEHGESPLFVIYDVDSNERVVCAASRGAKRTANGAAENDEAL